MDLPEYQTTMDMVNSKLDELGKNQRDLATEIGVNAGTLSRYIAGETEAGYETLRQIWEVLDRWEDREVQPAAELMTEGFSSVSLSDSRKVAADKMQRNNFSQLPVCDENDDVVGVVTDADLMRVHDDEKLISEVQYHHLIEITVDTSRRLVEDILDHGHSAVLVVDDNTPVGIITRADLLKSYSLSE